MIVFGLVIDFWICFGIVDLVSFCDVVRMVCLLNVLMVVVMVVLVLYSVDVVIKSWVRLDWSWVLVVLYLVLLNLLNSIVLLLMVILVLYRFLWEICWLCRVCSVF